MADPKHRACRPHQQAGCRGRRGERCLKKSLARFLNAQIWNENESSNRHHMTRTCGDVSHSAEAAGHAAGSGCPRPTTEQGQLGLQARLVLWHRPPGHAGPGTRWAHSNTRHRGQPQGSREGLEGSHPPARCAGPPGAHCALRTLPVHCGSRAPARCVGPPGARCALRTLPVHFGLRQPPRVCLTFSFIPCFGSAGSLCCGGFHAGSSPASGRRLKGRGARQRSPQGQRGPCTCARPARRLSRRALRACAGGPGWRAPRGRTSLPPETRSDEDWALGPRGSGPSSSHGDARRQPACRGSGLIALFLLLSLWPLSRDTPSHFAFQAQR